MSKHLVWVAYGITATIVALALGYFMGSLGYGWLVGVAAVLVLLTKFTKLLAGP